MRSPARITLRGHERRGDLLLLVFSVDDGYGEMAATVLVDRSGEARFPHALSDSGEPIGPVADAALRERAGQTMAVLEAAATWRAIRSSRRSRGERA